jgi:anti-sigma factor RsiW
MSTTPHLVAPEEIMAHLDGELSAGRSQSVSTHIESCAACQELVTSLRNTSLSLSNWSVAPLAVNTKFRDHLFAAVAKVPSSSRNRKFEVFPIHRWKWLAASSVLTILLITMIGVWTGRYERKAPRALAVASEAQKREAIETRLREEDIAQGKNQMPELARADLTLPKSKRPTNLIPTATPGIAADTNGVLHGLGDHAENRFSVDGQPLSDQQARVFTGPMISRTVSLSLFTKAFESSRASLDAILARHDGYAADLNVATPLNAARSLQASLRIPAPQLPAVLAELKSLGRVEGETQNGEEVTQQHADLVARLKNSRETEQRLQAILAERTGKIKDVLEVEQEIARVRGEIEQMEAEQKNLEHRVDFATINLQLSEEYKAELEPPAPQISTLLHNAAVNGYRNLSGTLLSIILFFAEYLPVLFFWILLLSIPGRLVWRRWRHAAPVS